MDKNEIEIKFLDSNEMDQILPLAQLLNPSISLEILGKRLVEMKKDGFQCLGVFVNSELAGMCGLWIQTRFYCGKMLEPDGVFIKESYRSLGIGAQLVSFIDNYAKKENCEVSELNCYLKNPKGLQFWRKNGYEDLGIHMQKNY